jgi:hypothetical protein
MLAGVLGFFAFWAFRSELAKHGSLTGPIGFAVATSVILGWTLIAWWRNRSKLFERLGHQRN